MDISLIIAIIIVSIILIGGIIFFILYRMKKNGGGSGGGGNVKPIPGKNYVIEKKYNSLIGKAASPYLVSFFGGSRKVGDPKFFKPDPNINGGYPWCQPTYFALRKIKVTDVSGKGPDAILSGDYGELSDWIGPIYSGAESFPCQNACSFPVGKKSCNFNSMIIGTSEQVNYPDILNLHMQVGTLNPKSEGVIINFMTPNTEAPMATFNNLWVLDNNSRTCKGC